MRAFVSRALQELLVEPGEALGQVCHYLHLNPVRAGIVPVERLAEYRYSSYWYLRQPKRRPFFLRMNAALDAAGELPDDARGWASYADYLAWQAAEGPAGKNAAYALLTRGWALGSTAFREALLHDHAVAADTKAWEGAGVREVKETRWRKALDAALAELSAKTKEDGRKSAPWKVAIAARMKATTDVSNGWLAEQLDMGSAFYVSKHVGLFQRMADAQA